ncbi:MAG: hypothetical protein KFF73_13695 [Cyclobacteriaceae bacterium]|nr:hypothetical protein [Cyclobacteriaceae bacterium]
MRFLPNHYLFILLIPGMIACGQTNEARKIVDQAIGVHGGKLYNQIYLEFDFRGRHYTARRQNGLFTYTREFQDSAGLTRDILTNKEFVRTVNGDTFDLPEERANAFTNSVNAVIYFALLPQALNDPAVNLELIDDVSINGKEYHKVKVTFNKQGGGKDHEDVFIYWFEKDTYRMDYFSYLFFSDGGGIRFRKAFNTRNINGIMVSDYKNYALNDTTFDITRIDSLYLNDELELLSEIRLENLQVTLLE